MGRRPRAQVSAGRWKKLFELFIVPRLIAFFLRRAFRMREPQRRQRAGVMVASEADRKRANEKEAFEQQRRDAVRKRRSNFNMV